MSCSRILGSTTLNGKFKNNGKGNLIITFGTDVNAL